MTLVSEGLIFNGRRAGWWPRIIMEEKMWYREVKEGPRTQRQTFLPEPIQREALVNVHNHLWAGQKGAKNTQMEMRYIWSTIKRNVREYCHSCPKECVGILPLLPAGILPLLPTPANGLIKGHPCEPPFNPYRSLIYLLSGEQWISLAHFPALQGGLSMCS